MQFIVISEQIKIMVFAVILGCIFALIYDIINTVRISINFDSKLSLVNMAKDLFIIHFIDIAYMTFASVSYCIFLYYFSSGHNRWYLFVSMVIGFLICRVSICRIFRKILIEVLSFIKLIFSKLIIKPIIQSLILIRCLFVPIIRHIKYKHLLVYTDVCKKSYLDDLYSK